MTNNKEKSEFFTIFILPFKYEVKNIDKLAPKKLGEKFTKGNKNSEKGWCAESYSIDNTNNYNEFYYFHPFIRRAIFNKYKEANIEYLTRTDYKELEVEYFEGNSTKTITTEIKSIDLHIFENQIGLLTITTEQTNPISFEEVLRYNDIVRRIYPPYFDNGSLESVKRISKMLPIKVSLKGNNPDLVENFPDSILPTENEERRYDDTVYISRIIEGILSPLELKKRKNMELKKGKFYFTHYADERMFILSYYSDAHLSGNIKESKSFENSDDWYRFIFVDGGYIGIENDEMKKELLNKHTYSRWLNYGTLFGMSRYSFVMLCDDSGFSRGFLKQQMKSMYYQISLIVLLQHAMLLKFEEDVNHLTEEFRLRKLSKDNKTMAENLHGDFIKFMNKYWTNEITPQEQGIEIYNQFRELTNITELFNEVKTEISELVSFVDNKIGAEADERLRWLTYWGAFLSALILFEGVFSKIIPIEIIFHARLIFSILMFGVLIYLIYHEFVAKKIKLF
ncbi:MAG: hypothetical protein A7315_06290 [Candidatus Altiarchaeales archaeon WOR_SM1_79]|nr:MAG: hypothetical protein A7315_06290 [Candidatus Altiarchaeales archaeon WOR_SM1_79]